jgi:hypothetical protein
VGNEPIPKSELSERLQIATFLEFCYYFDGDINDAKSWLDSRSDFKHFEYTHENILNYVNTVCGGEFDEIVILPRLSGYRVHAKKGGYNLGDKFNFDQALMERRKEINKYYYDLEKAEGKEYPNFGAWVDEHNPSILHIIRRFNGYNKHWEIDVSAEDWRSTITQTPLYDPGGWGVAK